MPMEKTGRKLKGRVKRGDSSLLVKRWYDDRIPEPFMWEFIDGNLSFGESPEEGMLRLITENLGVTGRVVRPAYTWSVLLGETHILGLAFMCELEDYDNFNLPEELGDFAWVHREEFEDYIDNINVLKDLQGKEL